MVWYVVAITNNHAGSAECANFQEHCKRSFRRVD